MLKIFFEDASGFLKIPLSLTLTEFKLTGRRIQQRIRANSEESSRNCNFLEPLDKDVNFKMSLLNREEEDGKVEANFTRRRERSRDKTN